MTNLEGHFFQQYLTENDKAQAEEQVVEALRREKRIEENQELKSKIVKELNRIFVLDSSLNFRVDANGVDDKVQFRFNLPESHAAKLGLSLVKKENYIKTKDIQIQGKTIGFFCEDYYEGQRCSRDEFYVLCHIADPDLDIKLKLIFDMAKLIFKLRPAIHTK